MQILDADKGEKLQSSTGRVQSRDIVQFVPFREVQGNIKPLFVNYTCSERINRVEENFEPYIYP